MPACVVRRGADLRTVFLRKDGKFTLGKRLLC
jgi:hypothetical protein